MFMKPLVILLILCCSSIAEAQNCKFTVNKKDEFTGEQTTTLVYDRNSFVWITIKRGAMYQLEMAFTSVESTAIFETTDTMRIKLADGTILKLRPNADVEPMGSSISTTRTTGSDTRYYVNSRSTSRSVTSTMATSTYNPVFTVDRSVYEQLAKSPVTVIRFDFAGKPWDFDFTRKPLTKAAGAIQDQARCILTVAR